MKKVFHMQHDKKDFSPVFQVATLVTKDGSRKIKTLKFYVKIKKLHYHLYLSILMLLYIILYFYTK